MGPRADLDGCGKTGPPPGFDPQTVAHLNDKKNCLGKIQTVSSVRTLGAQINDSVLTLKCRIKSHLPFAGIIRSSPYSTGFQNKG